MAFHRIPHPKVLLNLTKVAVFLFLCQYSLMGMYPQDDAGQNQTIVRHPVDGEATPQALVLYDFLRSSYGNWIISGQTNDWYERIRQLTGVSPVLRAFDFQHYTQGYAYKWSSDRNGFTLGAEDDGQVAKALEWYRASQGKGIVAFHWHWHSPAGGAAGTNTFYTAQTAFDVGRAVMAGTVEHDLILQDIDAVARQLKRLQDKGVPVIWRPLHEAGGGWFWWGAKGPEACRKLYRLMYERMTQVHGLHNLIWCWSCSEDDWYPGNDLVDLLGHDSYPGSYNYDPRFRDFSRYDQLSGASKMVAMTENGPIPDPDACLDDGVPWAFFMSWNDLVMSQNSVEHIQAVYANSRVMTLENHP